MLFKANGGLCGGGPDTHQTKGIERSKHGLPVREKLDDLQMNVVVWCPYKDRGDVRPFAQQILFFSFIKFRTDVRPYHPKRILRKFDHVHMISHYPPPRFMYQLCD